MNAVIHNRMWKLPLTSTPDLRDNKSGPEVLAHLGSGPSPHHSIAPRSEMS